MEIEQQIKMALARLVSLEAEIEASKALYAERDLLTLQLRDLGMTTVILEGKEFKLCDNFSDTNVCYRVAFVRRYEVKIKALKEKKEKSCD